MTRKTLAELTFGDVIGDMHDGIRGLQARYPDALITVTRWSHDDHQTILGHKTNKLAHVIGRTDDGVVIGGFSYDGRSSGLVYLIPSESN